LVLLPQFASPSPPVWLLWSGWTSFISAPPFLCVLRNRRSPFYATPQVTSFHSFLSWAVHFRFAVLQRGPPALNFRGGFLLALQPGPLRGPFRLSTFSVYPPLLPPILFLFSVGTRLTRVALPRTSGLGVPNLCFRPSSDCKLVFDESQATVFASFFLPRLFSDVLLNFLDASQSFSRFYEERLASTPSSVTSPPLLVFFFPPPLGFSPH